MNHYMVIITLPRTLTEEFLSLIPHQRAHVDGLMNSGMIASYSLSIERSRLWVTMVCESEHKVRELIDKFPLRRYMEIDIAELVLHKTLALGLPQMFMN